MCNVNMKFDFFKNYYSKKRKFYFTLQFNLNLYVCSVSKIHASSLRSGKTAIESCLKGEIFDKFYAE